MNNNNIYFNDMNMKLEGDLRIAKLNRMGDNTHPCRSPVETLKLLFTLTQLIFSLYMHFNIFS